jgi:endoglucanase
MTMKHLNSLALLSLLVACGGGGNTSAAAPAQTPSPPAAALEWRGVSLAGADFGEGSLPGTHGTHYIYPSAGSVDYFRRKGMNIVRLPFRWERLQPALGNALDATELARLRSFVDPVTATGVTVLLDPHNYARWHGNPIGSGTVTNSHFADFWSRLSAQFKANPRVAFGLMNEPHTLPTEQWLAAANAAIAAIRAAGANNLVTVPGNAWTGAHSWSQNWYGTPNATAMKGIVDPGSNMLFEVHQYFDADSSGTSSTCVSNTIGSERLAGFTAWLRANGYRAILGEFGGADNPTCRAAVAGALDHLEANADVCAGWTWWAAGPWWGNYMFSIEPAAGSDKPQMGTLAPFLD